VGGHHARLDSEKESLVPDRKEIPVSLSPALQPSDQASLNRTMKTIEEEEACTLDKRF
jgi:hypothetical protein